MLRTLKIVSATVATLVAIGALSGCKVSACSDAQAIDGGKQTTKDNCLQFEPTVEYDGTARTASQPWSSGKAVSIRNRNGDLTIASDSTSATDVQVSGIPFTRDGTSDAEKQSATNHLTAMASPGVSLDATGNVVIDGPGGGFDGYKLTVHLPSAFDGVIGATNDNGQIIYSGTPTTTGNTLHSDNGDVTATFGSASKVTATASTDLGVVVIRGAAWMSSMEATDQKSGSAVLGDGTGSFSATTGLGDVVIQAQ
jgi:hypothetical protein